MSKRLSSQKIALLYSLANAYETESFINGDPSCFMHQVKGERNQEVTAWVASVLSYGSRKQFMPKIQHLIDLSGGDMYQWIRKGDFHQTFPDDDTCFYRLYTHRAFTLFLSATERLLNEHGSIKDYLRHANVRTGLDAIGALCQWYRPYELGGIVPKDTTSCCKRVCMMMRWMVRDGSPVDLGLWNDLIDKRTLIIPMDTHVIRVATKLGLITSKSSSMSAAIKLTNVLKKVFPTDPLKADFALFGAGISRDID